MLRSLTVDDLKKLICSPDTGYELALAHQLLPYLEREQANPTPDSSLIDLFKKRMESLGYHPYGIAMTDSVDALTLAMGGGSATKAPVSAETVPPITSAKPYVQCQKCNYCRHPDTLECPECSARSEISDNGNFVKDLEAVTSRYMNAISYKTAALAILEAIRPYLRTTEPVSVSLEGFTRDMLNNMNRHDIEEEEAVKVTLEKHGVKYVD